MNTQKENTCIYSQERLIGQGKTCGILSQITDKNWNRLKKSRSFCMHDQAGVALFFFFSRTRTGSMLQWWCNPPSDCVEAFDPVCPPVSLG